MAEASPPTAAVQEMYRRLRTGDVDGARSMWADGAVWHLTGSHRFAKDYDVGEYLQMLAEWRATYPSYEAAYDDVRDVGDELAVMVLTSTGGMAPGPATGLMVFRVVDGVIHEGWGIPAFGAGRFAF